MEEGVEGAQNNPNLTTLPKTANCQCKSLLPTYHEGSNYYGLII